MKKEKLLALESLRGIAALSVAFFHFKTGSYFNNGFTDNAWLMVDFFFVLSGFVIALNYLDKISSWSALLTFQKKRFLRLYPLHLIMLLVFVGIEIVKYIAQVKFELTVNYPAFTTNNFTSFIANIFLVHNWTIPELTYNYPSWSISSEFYTYAIFALLILFSRNNIKIISLILLINIFLCAFLLDKYGFGTDNLQGPLRCLYSFSIGVIVCNLYRSLKNKYLLSNSSIPLTVILIVVLIVINYGTKEFEYIELIPLSFGMIILSLALTKKNTFINQTLSKNWLVYLGTISYGIYMIHAAFWWWLQQSLKFIFKLPTSIDQEGRVTLNFDNIVISNFISLAGIIIIIFLAHLSYQFVEKKLNSQKYLKK
jgi:peptidoglycan/LPS O-acetylase OafA/YrhL